MREPLSGTTLRLLADGAADADGSVAWPTRSWQALRDAGVLAWSIPARHGGRGYSAVELLTGYEDIASACLTTAFILSQREAAVRRLRTYPASVLLDRYLPAMARGECLMTVGLSQLTTSRQHGAAALTVVQDGNGYLLDGSIPWVTAADQADPIVIGGTQADGQQCLFLLPRATPGVSIDPPMATTALVGARTAAIQCANVHLDGQWLLAGPAEKILTGTHGGVGGVETSCLALGLARAALAYVQDESSVRHDLSEVVVKLQDTLATMRRQLHQAAVGRPTPDEVVRLRVNATRLALQATQVALVTAKGAGFVQPHPAQRWARQALFFLVWSCPRPTAEGLIGAMLSSVEDYSC